MGGHHVCLATHGDFEPMTRNRGLDFFAIEDSSRAFHGSRTGQKMMWAGSNPLVFLHHFARLRQPIMNQLMSRSFAACAGADVIVGSGTALLLGLAAAEKLGIPIVSTYLQPLGISRFQVNSLFPHCPAWMPLRAVYNVMSHVMAGEFLWQMMRTAINKARREVLQLPPFPPWGPLGLTRGTTALHGYSEAVIAKPRDWRPNDYLTGFWFLDRAGDWKPPARLADFLDSGPAPVYVGFGSMPNPDPAATTQLVLEALKRTGQRGILMAGWGGLEKGRQSDQFLFMESAPHDWLFPRVAAVVHHGGAGTTGAGLRAGVPSIIVPFMADQPFWGRRLFDLGVAPRPIPRRELCADRLAASIRETVHNQAMRRQARDLSRHIRSENGVERAVEIFDQHMGRARTLDFRRRMARKTFTLRRHATSWQQRTPVATEAH
jgi:UDP:flavonoid glycosyltransferase YjiC (YdhE family)